MTKILTAREVAKMLDISYKALLNNLKTEDNDIPFVKVGGTYRFSEEAVLNVLHPQGARNAKNSLNQRTAPELEEENTAIRKENEELRRTIEAVKALVSIF